MPKIKITEEEKQNKKLIENIEIQKLRLGINNQQLAIMLHMGLTALYARLKNPEKFTLKELRILKKKLYIEEIEEII